MTSPHVIVGAGPIGTALSLRLADEGHRVRLVTRSASGPDHPHIERVALDATDAAALAEASAGATVLYNCANPGSYPHWEREWPPLAGSILAAAERSGAVLVTMGNLYGYGPVDGPMTRSTAAATVRPQGRAAGADVAGQPRRARSWSRESDRGPRVGLPRTLVERPQLAARAVRERDTRRKDRDGVRRPRSAAHMDRDRRRRRDPRRAGQRRTGVGLCVDRAVESARVRSRGAAKPRAPRRCRRTTTATAAPLDPAHRRCGDPRAARSVGVLYQFDRPFVADGTETTETFGITPTAWEPLLEETAHAWRARATHE